MRPRRRSNSFGCGSFCRRGESAGPASPRAAGRRDHYTRGVEFGIGYFATHDGVGPGALARLVEERGHESLFFPEHTHIPASRETPYPAGGELPRKYFHSYDLFVALTRGRGRDLEAARRQRHLPGHRARPDHDRQGGRERRPSLGRAPGVRRRRGLEPRGDAQPRHRSARAHGDHGRAGGGDEGDLDAGRGELPRRARRLRAHLVLAEARSAATPARCS